MSNDKLFSLTKQAGLDIKKVAEIGVLSFSTSTVKQFIEDGVEADLYEAVQEFCEAIAAEIAGYKNAKLNCFAVSNYQGEMTLCMAGPSTFNAELSSTPAINHDKFDKVSSKTITVPCRDFSDCDPGDYDLVSVDIEGGEYSVLERMVSRPLVISLETQCRDYRNPYLDEITEWMETHGYRVWVWNDTDTIFYKGRPPRLGLTESIKAKWHNFRYFSGRL